MPTEPGTSSATARPDLDAVSAMLARNDLARLPLRDWPGPMKEFAPFSFATWAPVSRPYDIDALAEETLRLSAEDAFLVAIDGHGVSSWALSVAVKRSTSAVIGRVPVGNPMIAPQSGRACSEGVWRRVTAALAALEDAASHDVAVILDQLDGNKWRRAASSGSSSQTRWRALPDGDAALRHLLGSGGRARELRG